MSNEATLNKRLYDLMSRCVRCAQCTTGYENTEFELVCPIYKRFNFFTYSLGGIAQLGRAVREGWLDPTESVANIVYNCISCGACAEMCAQVDFRDMMELQHELRAKCVEVGQVPVAHMITIEGLKKDDNMMQKLKTERGKWAEGLEVKDVTREQAKVYYHAGCQYCFDEALWPIARGAVNLLKRAGVDVGIAGKDETCCGGRAFELGYQGEFIKYAENNLEMLRTAGIKTLVTSCADGYYAFKVLYDMFGKRGDLEVLHITEYLARLIKEGRLKLTKNVPLTVTYHDPCHLGRKVEPWIRHKGKLKAGEIYEPPREILNSIPGLKLTEMRRNRENAWCCGAGGGVVDAYPDFARWAAQERIDEAKSTGAEVMVTACPWCRSNFSDALQESNGKLKIYDIVELVEQAL